MRPERFRCKHLRALVRVAFLHRTGAAPTKVGKGFGGKWYSSAIDDACEIASVSAARGPHSSGSFGHAVAR